MKIRLARRRSDENRCLYCHDGFSKSAPLSCQSCGALYHHDCAEHCLNLGCAGELSPSVDQGELTAPSQASLWLGAAGLLLFFAAIGSGAISGFGAVVLELCACIGAIVIMVALGKSSSASQDRPPLEPVTPTPEPPREPRPVEEQLPGSPPAPTFSPTRSPGWAGSLLGEDEQAEAPRSEEEREAARIQQQARRRRNSDRGLGRTI